MSPEIIGAIIGPVVTAVLAIVGYSLQEWRRTRSIDDEHERAIEQAQIEVQFMAAWLSAVEKVGDADPQSEAKLRRGIQDLERAYSSLQAELRNPPPPPKQITTGSLLKGFFLIGLDSNVAKVVRLGYYCSLLFAFFWLLAVMFVDAELGDAEVAVVVLTYAFMTVVGLLPALITGLITAAIEHRYQAQVKGEERSEQYPLLPYSQAIGFPPPPAGASPVPPGPHPGYPVAPPPMGGPPAHPGTLPGASLAPRQP